MLEITAEGWVAIIGALGAFVTILGATVVGIVVAMNANKKVDAAAVRREELAAGAPPAEPPKA
mgnify:CR=1 FL=1